MSLFFASLTISLLLCALVLWSPRGWPQSWLGRDDPGDLARKQQGRPIPVAGLLVPTLVLLAFGALDFGSGLCLALLAVLGWVDDRLDHGLSWKGKLTAQLLILVLFFLYASTRSSYGTSLLQLSYLGFFSRLPTWLVLFLLCYLVLTAWNIYDNFDGGVAWMALAGLASCLILHGGFDTFPTPPFPLLILLSGAMLAFLPFNWPHARLYLGNAGSQTTGFALLLLTLPLGSQHPFMIPDQESWLPLLPGLSPSLLMTFLLPHLLPLLDLLQVTIGRGLRRRPLWVGDRMHLAHLLHRSGCKAPLVAPLLAATQILCVLAYVTL